MARLTISRMCPRRASIEDSSNRSFQRTCSRDMAGFARDDDFMQRAKELPSTCSTYRGSGPPTSPPSPLHSSPRWAAVAARRNATRSTGCRPTSSTSTSSSARASPTHNDDPEFYFRNYVVDGSASQSLVGIGSWSGVDRIRWEITENLLIGRKAYQNRRRPGQQGPAHQDAERHGRRRVQDRKPLRHSPRLQPADRRRAEHHRREHLGPPLAVARVHARRLVDEPGRQPHVGRHVHGQGVRQRRRSRRSATTSSDPNADDAPHLDASTRATSTSPTASTSSPAETASPFTDLVGNAPACLVVGIVTGSATYDCNAQEATVRSSFLRVDPNDDFEPLENTHAPLDIVGNPGGLGDSASVGILSSGPARLGPRLRLCRQALPPLRARPRHLEEEPPGRRVRIERRRGRRRQRGRVRERRDRLRGEHGLAVRRLPRASAPSRTAIDRCAGRLLG